MPTKEARKKDAQERAEPTVLTKATTQMAAREQASEHSRCRKHHRASKEIADGTGRSARTVALTSYS